MSDDTEAMTLEDLAADRAWPDVPDMTGTAAEKEARAANPPADDAGTLTDSKRVRGNIKRAGRRIEQGLQQIKQIQDLEVQGGLEEAVIQGISKPAMKMALKFKSMPQEKRDTFFLELGLALRSMEIEYTMDLFSVDASGAHH